MLEFLPLRKYDPSNAAHRAETRDSILNHRLIGDSRRHGAIRHP
jgi:hypothetical protein